MKKTTISVSILFFAVFTAFGQSVTLVPTSSNQVSLRTYGSQIASFSGYHSEGSSSSPTATLNNKILAGMYGYGYGSFFNTTPNASIEFRASGNFNIINNGTEISFNTTPFNSSFVLERMRIADDGNVGIGTATPQTTLEVRTPTQSYGIQHSDGTVNLATYVSDQSGGWLGTRTNHPLSFYVNSGGSKLSIATTGNVTVSDFTKLGGASAPAIKQKIITGFNTPASQGASMVMAHGLNPAKILSVNIFVEATEGFTMLLYQTPPNYKGSSDMEYFYAVTPTNVELSLSSSDSARILSKPIRVFITYME
jgi:hypothetical protein